NAKKVQLTATTIKVSMLLEDIKKYLSSKPKELDWGRVNADDIGSRLITEKQTQYLGDVAATWEMPLDPAKDHFDRLTRVSPPIEKAGAYLLTARVEGGNQSHLVLWINDTVIVKKPIQNHTYYFVADARTGVAVPGATLQFFGWNQE